MLIEEGDFVPGGRRVGFIEGKGLTPGGRVGFIDGNGLESPPGSLLPGSQKQTTSLTSTGLSNFRGCKPKTFLENIPRKKEDNAG